MRNKRRVSLSFSIFGILAFVCIAFLFGCNTAAIQESNTTYYNRQEINKNIPVPSIAYSSRRWVLVTFYSAVLSKPRLRTCTVVTSRGGNTTGEDLLGIAETIGVPVNLSNQVTSPTESEPDSIYPGTNDQTVFVLRNGIGVISEADTTAITGDCPPGLHPNTKFQSMVDYEQGLQSGTVNFLPPASYGS